jgi:hypothetical protein
MIMMMVLAMMASRFPSCRPFAAGPVAYPGEPNYLV